MVIVRSEAERAATMKYGLTAIKTGPCAAVIATCLGAIVASAGVCCVPEQRECETIPRVRDECEL